MSSGYLLKLHSVVIEVTLVLYWCVAMKSSSEVDSLAEGFPQAGHFTLPRRLLVVFNPTAGARRRRRLDRFLRAVAAGGAEVTLRQTTAAGDAEAFARTASQGDYDALVVAGGDGTINEAINGLLRRAPEASALPLGLVPLGTANVLARELGLPLRPERAAATILAGKRRRVAVGEANGRAFALMAGVGFDAAVVAGISPRLKRSLRQGAYVLETLRQAFRFPFPRYRVEVGGEVLEARSLIACKARCYGGSHVLAPDQRLEEPRLTLVLFRSGGPLAVARFGLALLLGRVARCRDVLLVPAADALVSRAAGSVGAQQAEPVQGDGDIIARLPLRLGVRADAIELLAPTRG